MPSISPGVIVGGLIVFGGMGLLFLLAKGLSGGRMLRVPDGVPADQYYRQWRDGALGKKISRGMVFVAFAAVAMLLGGCGVAIISWR